MSFKFTDAVFKAKLPATDKNVLRALAERANDNGVCWPSHRTVAKDSGHGKSTVKTSIGLLTDYYGVVSVTGQREGRYGPVNEYTLNLERIKELANLVLERPRSGANRVRSG